MTAPTPHQRLTRAGLSHAFANLILKQHAHQLAETIRAQDPAEAALAGQAAWHLAADLIDPEEPR